jgi:GDP-L-fucose synthase
MVGSAICRRLAAEHCELLTIDRRAVDLRRQAEVAEFQPQAVGMSG